MRIYVDTPQGQKFHGELEDGYFYRFVDHKKDFMRIFQAWSIHPDALTQLSDLECDGLRYVVSEDERYEISLEDARRNGFEKSFKGGPTIYIPVKFWSRDETKKRSE